MPSTPSFRHGLPLACLVSLLSACGSDTTAIFASSASPNDGVALLPAEPSASTPPENGAPASTDGAERSPAESLRAARRPTVIPIATQPEPADSLDELAAIPVAPAAAPLALPCVLELEWSDIVASHAGCEPLSAALGVERLLWDGSQVTLLGEAIDLVGTRIERTRRCPHAPSQSWRFVEAFDFGAVLPAGHCPTAFSASYAYTECQFQSPGRVCSSAAATQACSFSATLHVTPAAEQPAAADAGAPAAAASEAQCLGIGTPPIRVPVLLGAACRETRECQAGTFCSREQTGGACLPLGEGSCQPAPSLAECSDAAEPTCGCEGFLFPPTLPNGMNTNNCRIRALGETTVLCE